MIERIFRNLREIKLNPLGRWCLNDKSKTNWKVDMANIDHCGTCSYHKAAPEINNQGALVIFAKKENAVLIIRKNV